MTLALLATSHSPLLEHAELAAEVSVELESAFAEARRFVCEFDPDVIVNFAPDHYNGFFYQLMPPFCIGYAAESIGDYGSQAAGSTFPKTSPARSPRPCSAMASTSPYRWTCGSTTVPCSPWRSSTATSRRSRSSDLHQLRGAPFTPVRRVRLLGEAVGRHLASLDKKVLLISSGGLSHDPPVPGLATATPEQRRMLMGHAGHSLPRPATPANSG